MEKRTLRRAYLKVPRRPKTRDYWIYNPDNKHPRHEDLKEVPIGRLVSQGPKFSKLYPLKRRENTVEKTRPQGR